MGTPQLQGVPGLHAACQRRFISSREAILSALCSGIEVVCLGRSPGAWLAVWQLLLKGDKHFVNKQGAWGMALADRGHC